MDREIRRGLDGSITEACLRGMARLIQKVSDIK